MESTLNLNLNTSSAKNSLAGEASATNLKPQLDELSKILSGFQTTLRDFTGTLNKKQTAQTRAEKDQIQLEKLSQRKEISRLNAEKYTPEYIAGRTASQQAALNRSQATLARQTKADTYYTRAQEYREAGKNKDADRLERKGDLLLTDSKLDNENQKGIKNFWAKAALAFTTGFVADKINQYTTIDRQMGIQGFNNPMMNGYNFGNQYEAMANLGTQKSMMGYNLAGTGVGALIGGALGSLAGTKGALMGAELGAYSGEKITSVFTGRNTANQAIKNRILSQEINNRMNLEALRATSMRAFSTTESGMMGHSISDVETPFIIAISKATALYNQNSKAMGDLTKNVVNFAQASQLSIGDAMKVGAGAAYLSNDKSFSFNRAKRLFNTYGITDYAGAMTGAVNFAQMGFNSNQALEMSVAMQGQNAGFQQAVSGYYSDPLRRLALSQVTGGKSEAFHNMGATNHAMIAARARSLVTQMNQNPMSALSNSNFLKYFMLTGETNIQSNQIFPANVKKILPNAVGTTGLQAGYYQTQNQLNRGSINTDEYTQKLRGLADSSIQAGQSLDNLTKQGNLLASAFSGIINALVHNSNSNTFSGSSESTQTKKY